MPAEIVNQIVANTTPEDDYVAWTEAAAVLADHNPESVVYELIEALRQTQRELKATKCMYLRERDSRIKAQAIAAGATAAALCLGEVCGLSAENIAREEPRTCRYCGGLVDLNAPGFGADVPRIDFNHPGSVSDPSHVPRPGLVIGQPRSPEPAATPDGPP